MTGTTHTTDSLLLITDILKTIYTAKLARPGHLFWSRLQQPIYVVTGEGRRATICGVTES